MIYYISEVVPHNYPTHSWQPTRKNSNPIEPSAILGWAIPDAALEVTINRLVMNYVIIPKQKQKPKQKPQKKRRQKLWNF
jgi:hypothetical protein